MSNIVESIPFYNSVVDLLDKTENTIDIKNLDHFIYQLKTLYYEDEIVENLLCLLIQKTDWLIPDSIEKYCQEMKQNKNRMNDNFPLLSESFLEYLLKNKDILDEIYQNKQGEHLSLSYFGLETLNQKYLLKNNQTHVQENLDWLMLRVAAFIHGTNWQKLENTFHHLRKGYYTHATPTLFNAGTKSPQLASCFAPGTLVLTNLGYKPIEHVTVGDKVWTHQHRWKSVLQCHENNLGNRDLYEVTFMNKMGKLTVTEDHPFYVIDEKTQKITWKPIKDCSNTDSIVTKYNFLNEYDKRQEQLKGLLYSSKSIGFDQYKVCIQHGHSKRLFHDLCRMNRIRILSSKLHLLYTEYIFEYNVQSSPNLTEYLNNSISSFENFLKGMELSYHSPSWKKQVLVQYKEFHTFQTLMKRHDIEILNFRNVDYDPSKCLFIYEKNSHLNTLNFNHYHHVVKIKKKKVVKNHNLQHVYTLGVEEDHSYTVENVIVKNCFLMGTEDSIEGIFESISDCAKISKFAGGIGLHIHDIRASKSFIQGTNGTSNGIIPMLRVYNNTARYIDQGGGKRNGAFAIYLECWHADIIDFLALKKNTGSEESRARDLFYALWINDRFMYCVEKNKDWFLFNPNDVPFLSNLHGDEFTKSYKELVRQKKYMTKIPARELWKEICKIQIETGTPYILFKDTCNRLSNQQNLGTIRSSNLCCEIIQYSDNKEYAVCNLASIALPKFLKPNPLMENIEKVYIYGKNNCVFCKLSKYFSTRHNIEMEYIEKQNFTQEDVEKIQSKTFPNIYVDLKTEKNVFVGGFDNYWKTYLQPVFDYEKLGEVVQELVENLNNVIDKSMYPLDKCKNSNMKHRPMGIGVQGLADVFMESLLPYDCEEAKLVNKRIFETMYFNALKKSNEIAKEQGHYESFKGSPLSMGKFHFDLYQDVESWKESTILHYDWENLRKDIVEFGTRNSLFIAPMPTASTSQILNNTESFEPLTSNFYVRRTSSGEFYVINRSLQKILKGIQLWDKDMHERLVFDKGSVMNNERIPKFLKEIYRTVWEIPQKHVIDMASDRQRFIDQSQSMNIYLTNPSIDVLTKIIFYGWKKQLKTGCYYVRTRALTSSQNFYLDASKENQYNSCENCSS